MNLKFFWILAILPFLYSCQSSPTETNGPAVVDLNDTSNLIDDSIGVTLGDLRKVWKEVSEKLPALNIPAKIICSDIKEDSVQFELTQQQIEQLIPKEVLIQKDPVVAALFNSVMGGDTIGTFYSIQYPVVYNKLTDITCQVLLVLYTKDGHYSDYKTLAIHDYGVGYSNFKSNKEIIYLYKSEKETGEETDIVIYDSSDKVSIRKVNSMHLISKSQEEYEKNNQLIDKLSK